MGTGALFASLFHVEAFGKDVISALISIASERSHGFCHIVLYMILLVAWGGKVKFEAFDVSPQSVEVSVVRTPGSLSGCHKGSGATPCASKLHVRSNSHACCRWTARFRIRNWHWRTKVRISNGSIHPVCQLFGMEKNLVHFSICACHPSAGAMLIFSVSFQFYRMIPQGNPGL